MRRAEEGRDNCRSPLRRAWIEVTISYILYPPTAVTLLTESVDRSMESGLSSSVMLSRSPSRRAWIEVQYRTRPGSARIRRSPSRRAWIEVRVQLTHCKPLLSTPTPAESVDRSDADIFLYLMPFSYFCSNHPSFQNLLITILEQCPDSE